MDVTPNNNNHHRNGTEIDDDDDDMAMSISSDVAITNSKWRSTVAAAATTTTTTAPPIPRVTRPSRHQDRHTKDSRGKVTRQRSSSGKSSMAAAAALASDKNDALELMESLDIEAQRSSVRRTKSSSGNSVKLMIARTLSGSSSRDRRRLSVQEMEEARPLTPKRPTSGGDGDDDDDDNVNNYHKRRPVKKVPKNLGHQSRRNMAHVETEESYKTIRTSPSSSDEEPTCRTASSSSDDNILMTDIVDGTDVNDDGDDPTPAPRKTLAEIRRAKLQQGQSSCRNKIKHSSSSSSLVGVPQQQTCCGISRKFCCCIVVAAVVGVAVGLLVPMLIALNDSKNNHNAVNDQTNHMGKNNSNGDPLEIMTDPYLTIIDPTKRPSLTLSPFLQGPNDDMTEQQPQDDAEGSTVQEQAAQQQQQVQQQQQQQEPAIDVWNLFGSDTTSSIPLATPAILSLPFESQRLEQAAKLVVQGTIHANIQKPKLRLEQQKSSSGSSLAAEYVVPFMDTPLAYYDGEVPSATAAQRAPAADDKYPQGDVSQWEELLQHAGVHDADIVQYDEPHGLLYIGTGQQVDVVDVTTGVVRTRIKLPSEAPVNDETEKLEQGLLLRDSWLIPMESDEQEKEEWKPAPPTPFIEQLLLTSSGEYLVVVVSNYTAVHKAKTKPLVQDYLATHLLTYKLTHIIQDADNNDDNDVTTYELIGGPHPIHGRVLYAAQATSNQHIHIVTSSRIDTARFLQNPLERLYYPDPHDKMYVEEALLAAQEKFIPLYSERLIKEIEELEEVSIWPVTQWITGGDFDLTEQEQQLQAMVTTQEHLLQELIVVTSLSIVETNSVEFAEYAPQSSENPWTGTTTATVSTALIGPPLAGVIGSTDTLLTLCLPGYQWSSTGNNNAGATSKVLEEATHVLQFELGTISLPGSSNKAATRFQTMATVPGRLVQSPRHSTERRGRELRLATVATRQWALQVSREKDDTEMEERLFVAETDIRKSYMNLLDASTLRPKMGSPLKLFDGEGTLLSAVSFSDTIAYAFPLEPLSVSANKTSVQVVEFISPSEEDDEEEGSLHLLGSMKSSTPGFSPHLHPLATSGEESKRKILVSIGESEPEKGATSASLMVSLWDATDPIEIEHVAQHSLDDPGLLATWSPRLFRLSSQGQLILPMTVEYVGGVSQENMRGFVVLDVSSTEIVEQQRISHSTVVMNRSDCIPGDGLCPLEARAIWTGSVNPPMLLTVEGDVVKRTALSTTGVDSLVEDWTLLLN